MFRIIIISCLFWQLIVFLLQFHLLLDHLFFQLIVLCFQRLLLSLYLFLQIIVFLLQLFRLRMRLRLRLRLRLSAISSSMFVCTILLLFPVVFDSRGELKIF